MGEAIGARSIDLEWVQAGSSSRVRGAKRKLSLVRGTTGFRTPGALSLSIGVQLVSVSSLPLSNPRLVRPHAVRSGAPYWLGGAR